jgi:hypothetical protein
LYRRSQANRQAHSSCALQTRHAPAVNVVVERQNNQPFTAAATNNVRAAYACANQTRARRQQRVAVVPHMRANRWQRVRTIAPTHHTAPYSTVTFVQQTAKARCGQCAAKCRRHRIHQQFNQTITQPGLPYCLQKNGNGRFVHATIRDIYFAAADATPPRAVAMMLFQLPLSPLCRLSPFSHCFFAILMSALFQPCQMYYFLSPRDISQTTPFSLLRHARP